MILKLTTKKVILFLTTALLLFHTLTYLQTYYAFLITAGVFGLIVLLFIAGNKKIAFDKKMKSVLVLDVSAVILIITGIFIKNLDPVQVIGQFLPYIIWPTLYAITEPLFDAETRKKVINWYVVILAIGVVATLKVVSVDNEAARLLAGAATEVKRYEYYRQGVGGYGFVYGTVFSLFCICVWMLIEKKKTLKFALVALFITICMMILYASYTTALLMTLAVVAMGFLSRTKKKNVTVYFLLGICLVAVFFEDILIGIRNFADSMDIKFITKRINQLLEAETTGNLDGLRRVELYRISFNTFLNNLLLGGTEIGGHSLFLDTMANYGLLGVMFVVSFCRMLNEERHNCKIMKGVIYYLCIIFLCINTMDVIVLLPMMTFALPLFLKTVEDKQNTLKR